MSEKVGTVPTYASRIKDRWSNIYHTHLENVGHGLLDGGKINRLLLFKALRHCTIAQLRNLR